jgi:hypothetical protein
MLGLENLGKSGQSGDWRRWRQVSKLLPAEFKMNTNGNVEIEF